MDNGILDEALKIRTDLVFDQAPDLWFYAALALALVFLVFHYQNLRKTAPVAARLLLMVTRGILAAAILLFLMKPTILKQKTAPLRVRQPVLVDTTRSMSLEYREGESRFDMAEKIIGRLSEKEEISSFADIDVFGFDDGIRPLSRADMEAMELTGRKTDIPGAMSDLSNLKTAEYAGQTIVLTDGRQSVDAAGPPPPGDWVFVGIGNSEPFLDVQVAALKVADMGFERKPLEISALVRSTGYGELKVPLLFKVDGRLVTIKDLVIPPEGEQEVKFQWTPQERGVFQVTVELSPQPDEKVEENNRLEAAVRIVRDRIRVLFISGSPTWNYRFLREALKKDPSLDLISFIILRSPTDIVDVPQDEISLIPFPTKRLFTTEINTFDLVIFDNFSFRPYFPAGYLENLSKFVKEGGALWMWGGSLTFVDGSYQGTALEKMLPFSLEGPSLGEGYIQQDFKVRFTREAWSSPIFNLVRDAGVLENKQPDLPGLSGFNVTGPARDDAVVLAEHPTFETGGGPQPIIAMRNFGEGRVMAVATDYLWAWDFVAAGDGLGNRTYLDFVKNSIRWLADDPLLSPVKLGVYPESAVAGESVIVRARVLDEHYRPVENASLDLNAFGPDGRKYNLKAVPTGEEGIYDAEFRIPAEGSYRFNVVAAASEGKLGEAQVLMSAAGYREEISSPSMDGEFLEGLAAATEGKYLVFRDEDAFYDELAGLLKAQGEKTRLISEERVGLGSLPSTFIFLLVLLSADWIVRKRFRLE